MIFFIAIESFTGNHEEKIGLPHRSATSVCHIGLPQWSGVGHNGSTIPRANHPLWISTE